MENKSAELQGAGGMRDLFRGGHECGSDTSPAKPCAHPEVHEIGEVPGGTVGTLERKAIEYRREADDRAADFREQDATVVHSTMLERIGEIGVCHLLATRQVRVEAAKRVLELGNQRSHDISVGVAVRSDSAVFDVGHRELLGS